ncbi:hypothetical protein ACFY1U_16655 [Streptomyces sp. NPDC001351]|uniref:hypothetical protein n=1 Tax=Streptomyces sp. NPDC001351 TaxID=3364564 RepID=UPI00369C08B8
MFGLLACNALPDGRYADTALYAMTLTVLGSVLLHGGGSVATAPPPSADQPDAQVVDTRG